MEFNSKNLTQNSKPEGTKKLGNWRRKDNKFPWSYSEKQSLTITWDFKRKKPWVLSACVLTQLYMTLCNPVDCSPPGSSVHEIFQARILVWVAISSSEDQICLSWISCMGRWILYCWATWEAPLSTHYQYKEEMRIWNLDCQLEDQVGTRPIFSSVHLSENTKLPWWYRGKESACQRRGRRFDPWSRKIPHTKEQLHSQAQQLQSLHSRAFKLQLLNLGA